MWSIRSPYHLRSTYYERKTHQRGVHYPYKLKLQACVRPLRVDLLTRGHLPPRPAAKTTINYMAMDSRVKTSHVATKCGLTLVAITIQTIDLLPPLQVTSWGPHDAKESSTAMSALRRTCHEERLVLDVPFHGQNWDSRGTMHGESDSLTERVSPGP